MKVEKTSSNFLEFLIINPFRAFIYDSMFSILKFWNLAPLFGEEAPRFQMSCLGILLISLEAIIKMFLFFIFKLIYSLYRALRDPHVQEKPSSGSLLVSRLFLRLSHYYRFISFFFLFQVLRLFRLCWSALENLELLVNKAKYGCETRYINQLLF